VVNAVNDIAWPHRTRESVRAVCLHSPSSSSLWARLCGRVIQRPVVCQISRTGRNLILVARHPQHGSAAGWLPSNP